jgi:hypothetical protein
MADEITLKKEVVEEARIEPFNNESQDILPVSEPIEVTESQTAQIPVNEPLPTPTELETEPVVETIPTETKSVETTPEEKPLASSEPKTPEPDHITISEVKPEPVEPISIPVIIPSKNLARELLIKARNMIQFRKRKKLDKIMTLFLKKSKITNDEVEKFMHVSDATAERYLNILEKENKIKQTGKTGKAVSYSKK